MSYRYLQYSTLTDGSATITVPFIDSSVSSRYSVFHQLNSGCTVSCATVHSICNGIVVLIGNAGRFSVTIQYNDNICITYANLSSVAVTLNQSVVTSDVLGTADRWVRVELLRPDGPSTVWPVRIGAAQYYKQDPESYISGQASLPDEGAAAYLSAAYPQSFDYTLLSPYIVTLTHASPQVVSWDALKSLRVAGAVIEAGQLYDASHNKQPQFMNPKVPRWIEDIQEAGVLHGYYFNGRATSIPEAKDEIYELSYILRNWPATLGVWVVPYFTRTVTTNDVILDTYRDALVELGLSGSIGIYTDRSTMDKFSWKDKQLDWLLWLEDRCNAVDEFDRLLDPDFFRLEAVSE